MKASSAGEFPEPPLSEPAATGTAGALDVGAEGVGVGVGTTAGARTVSTYVSVSAGAVPLSAVIVTVVVPGVVGVPEMTPVVGLIVSPGGRVPPSEYFGAGVPVAVTGNE